MRKNFCSSRLSPIEPWKLDNEKLFRELEIAEPKKQGDKNIFIHEKTNYVKSIHNFRNILSWAQLKAFVSPCFKSLQRSLGS